MPLPLSGRKEWYHALSNFISNHWFGWIKSNTLITMYTQEVNGNAIKKKGSKRPLVEERLVAPLASVAMIDADG